jgi:signal peptidase I
MKNLGRTILLFCSVIIAALLVKIFAIDLLFVSGPSMRPTLTAGTPIIEFKLAWGIPVPFSNRYLVRWGVPRVGDVVVYPLHGNYVVKRCAATAGMKLEFSRERGYSVFVGEKRIPLDERQYQNLKDARRVPEGMIFALGDNMTESRDSRDYGFVSIDSVRGKALWK